MDARVGGFRNDLTGDYVGSRIGWTSDGRVETWIEIQDRSPVSPLQAHGQQHLCTGQRYFHSDKKSVVRRVLC